MQSGQKKAFTVYEVFVTLQPISNIESTT